MAKPKPNSNSNSNPTPKPNAKPDTLGVPWSSFIGLWSGSTKTASTAAMTAKKVIEGRATIRKRAADVDEHYTVEFANKPGVTYQRCVRCWP
jgi:hypothetical protein